MKKSFFAMAVLAILSTSCSKELFQGSMSQLQSIRGVQMIQVMTTAVEMITVEALAVVAEAKYQRPQYRLL